MQRMKFALDENPGLWVTLLYGLQWWIVCLPNVLITGLIVARMHFPADAAMQTLYLQKLFGLMGAVMLVQVLWGHRLPLVVGPAAILLVGISASAAPDSAALHTAILLGGAALLLLACSGLLARLRLVFTPRIVAVVLMLIAFSLAPVMLRLIGGAGNAGSPAFNAAFALLLLLALLALNTVLRGIWKSLTVPLGLAGGSAAYFFLTGAPLLPGAGGAAEGFALLTAFHFDGGTVLAFLFCYLALVINELGSIESIAQLINVQDRQSRIRRGTGVQGLANMAAGGLGLIGCVDYSLSAGVIAATGCASRYPLVPAGIGLMLCAFFPDIIRLLGCIPPVIMGALLVYLMAAQLSSGLGLLAAKGGVTDFNSGLTVALPLMIGLLTAFTPDSVTAGYPALLRPIAGNGFVMGVIAVLVLEHLIFVQKDRN